MSESHTHNSGSLKIEHIELLEEAVYPWDVELQQLSAGLHTSHMDFLQCNGILLYREFWSQSVHAKGLSPAGHQMIGSALQNPTLWCGRKIDTSTYAHGYTDAEMDFTTPVDSHHLVLLMPDDMFCSTFGEEAGQALSKDHIHHLHYRGKPTDSPVYHWDQLISRYRENPGQLTIANSRKALQSQIEDGVASLIYQGTEPLRKPIRSKQNKVMKDALAIIESRLKVISIPKLAKLVGVSQRVLELTFQQQLGVSPVGYMHRWRLQQAREELAAGDPGVNSVSKAALRWGFTELGRFSVKYRELFGERPSDTLKISRSTNSLRYLDLLRKK